jgi:hypothetical protein
VSPALAEGVDPGAASPALAGAAGDCREEAGASGAGVVGASGATGTGVAAGGVAAGGVAAGGVVVSAGVDVEPSIGGWYSPAACCR